MVDISHTHIYIYTTIYHISYIIYRISYITYHIYFDGFSSNVADVGQKSLCRLDCWGESIKGKTILFVPDYPRRSPHETKLVPQRQRWATHPMRSSNESSLNPPGPFFDFMWSGYNHWFKIFFGISESWIWTPRKLLWFLSQIINHSNPQLFP